MTLVTSFLLAMPVLAAAPARASLPMAFHTVRQQYVGTTTVEVSASIGRHVLLVNTLANGSNELVMFDAAHNSSTIVQAWVRGGASLSASSIVAAGGSFYLVWFNSASGHDLFQRVNVGGAAHFVSFPLGLGVYWGFAFGNTTSMFVSSGKFLVELNATTRGLIANLSAFIPTGIAVSSVLPIGSRLFVAGSQVAPSGTSTPFFGYLNRATHRFTNVSTTSASTPKNLGGAFYTMYHSGGRVYVGGGLTATVSTPYSFSTAAGMLYAYSLRTGSYVNLSGLLLNPRWTVFALENWSGNVALSASGYGYGSSGFTITGGIGVLSHHGSKMTNETFRLGPGYTANAYLVTSESGDYFYSGGANSASGLAEVVAIRL